MEAFSILSWLCPALCAALFLTVLVLLRRRPGRRPELPQLVEMEDALKKFYYLQQEHGVVKAEGLAEAMGTSVEIARGLMGTLAASGWARGEIPEGMNLTRRGEERAQELIRAHRLWERYLLDRKGKRLEEVHSEADRREHEMTPQEAAELDAEMDYPAWDPHGDIIPDVGRPVPPPPGRALTECESGRLLRIVRVANEPPVLFAQLVAMGIKPGVELEIADRKRESMGVKIGEDTLSLAISAAEVIRAVDVPVLLVPLDELPVGSLARVVEVKGGGQHQRRMLDMGLVPGAEVGVIRRAPLGDPIEYSVKETRVAMRKTDARRIMVEEARASEPLSRPRVPGGEGDG